MLFLNAFKRRIEDARLNSNEKFFFDLDIVPFGTGISYTHNVCKDKVGCKARYGLS